MKLNSRIMLFVSALFIGFTASAESYQGYYQLKDSAGSVVFQNGLKLTTKEVSKNKFEYVYEEVTQKGVVKTTCNVEFKSRYNGGRSISEKCPGSSGYTIDSECDDRLCSGITVWSAFSPVEMPASAIDTKSEKRVLMNTVDPVEYLGLKGIKTYSHVLILQKADSAK